jgi:uncharacterized SAM-binding protein YcdF (DUF218 family)
MLALLGGLLAWGLVWRGRPRAGSGLALLCLGGLWAVSTPWVAWALAMPLESRHPPVPAAASPAADAVLVLGGAMQAARPPGQPHLGFGSAADRVWHAAALYRAGKARWVMAIGGNRPGYEDVAPEAEAMAEVLRALGVPASALRLEGRSRNTRENAANSVALVRQVGAKRVLLVTSALHMPRALAVFQGVFAGSGVTIIPAATDAEALGDEPRGWAAWLPDAKSLEWSTRSVKEVLGLAQVGMTIGWR